jgi:hypothetical protein
MTFGRRKKQRQEEKQWRIKQIKVFSLNKSYVLKVIYSRMLVKGEEASNF